MTRIELITLVFYSTHTLRAWLLEKWRLELVSIQRAELGAGVHAVLVRRNSTKAANSAPVTAILVTKIMTSELFL